MIGGLIKSNRLAVLAGSAFIAGGLAVSPAKAADLGGDCCADLEERVAVLEATTARKGNRKVSLTISGFVYQQLMVWDDGYDDDAYVGTQVNDAGTQIGFRGNAKIDSNWSAGYELVIHLTNADSTTWDQSTDEGIATSAGTVTIARSNMWIKSEQLGQVTWGYLSPASDNLAFVDFSGIGSALAANMVLFDGSGFFVKGPGNTTYASAVSLGANVNWGNLTGCHGVFGGALGINNDCHGSPRDGIRYDTPTIAGFTFSASWGENDYWDVAARYNGQWGDFKVYGGVSYTEIDDTDGSGAGANGEVETLQLAGALMHVPTGIFVNGTWNHQEVNGVVRPDSDSWYVKAGIRQKWNSLGAAVLYGEYGGADDAFTTGLNVNGVVTGSEFERYGLGVVQEIDAAAMALFLKWKHHEGETSVGAVTTEFEDLDMFMAGGVIFF